MNRLPARFKRLRDGASAPEYATCGAAGADIRACIPEKLKVAPGETAMLPTGLAIELPEGYAGLVCARSGLSVKRGLAPANKVGVIDSDYRGELTVALFNHGPDTAEIAPGDRIAQLLIVPVVTADFSEADELPDTPRGDGGFGSTGK